MFKRAKELLDKAMGKVTVGSQSFAMPKAIPIPKSNRKEKSLFGKMVDRVKNPRSNANRLVAPELPKLEIGKKTKKKGFDFKFPWKNSSNKNTHTLDISTTKPSNSEYEIDKKRPSFSSLFNSTISGALAQSVATAGVKITASATLGPLFGIAAGLAVGIGKTAYKAKEDYKNTNSDKGFASFIFENKGTYGKKMAYTSLAAGLGAVGITFADDIADYFSDTKEIGATIATAKTMIHKDLTLPNIPSEKIELDAVNNSYVEQAPENTIIYEPASANDLLNNLLLDESVSDEAKITITSALNGEAWAMREAGLGMINGEDGFDNLEKFGPTVDAKIWGAEILQEAADAGDEKAMLNNAYFEYHSLYGSVDERASALATIEELDKTWVGGEQVLDDLKRERLYEAMELAGIEDHENCLTSTMPNGAIIPNCSASKDEVLDAMKHTGMADTSSCEVKPNIWGQGFIVSNCAPKI